MTLYSHLDSPLGELLATSREGAITSLHFTGQKHAPAVDASWRREDDAEIFGWLRAALEDYASGGGKEFDLGRVRLAGGTAFQLKVWREIGLIPFGRTISYGELARRAGAPEAVRAAGAAAGRNPVCWIIPCHRVTGKNGALTGYAGGLERKRALLDFESGRSAELGAFSGALAAA
jgi:methylated-DNA-[protein]-cysteine S-methyltransferase